MLAAVLAYCSWFFPSPQFRQFIRDLAGQPAYEGAWVAAEHLLLYTTLCAGVCLVVWWALARRGLVVRPVESFGFRHKEKAILGWGFLSGLAVFALSLGAAVVVIPEDKLVLGLFFSGWVIVGNLFSNLYEEIIYRGLLLVAVGRALDSRILAVVLTSVLFGAVHTQYPLSGRIVVGVMGAVAGLAYLKTGSLWAAWLNHMTVDVLMDTFLQLPT